MTYYDYERQCWVYNGRVAVCGHRVPVDGCYACAHVGEAVPEPQEGEGENHG